MGCHGQPGTQENSGLVDGLRQDYHTNTSQLSEVAIVEAGNIEKGVIARIKVPFRLRVQVHGNWVPANEL
jgi:carotenoid cleavage dioxygenase